MSENRKFSVLMSVYVKENPAFLEEAVESILHQTLKPSEVVIVEDGPLTPELYQVLEKLEAQSSIPIKRCPLEQNRGLGLALQYGVLQCNMTSLLVWIQMILLLKTVSNNSLN